MTHAVGVVVDLLRDVLNAISKILPIRKEINANALMDTSTPINLVSNAIHFAANATGLRITHAYRA
jgi:hypothetical protein